MQNNNFFNKQKENIKLDIVNMKTIKHLNLILKKINDKNINSILLFHSNYNTLLYNTIKLKTLLNAHKIIDLSNISLPHKVRIDMVHLRNEGRLIYSAKILDILENQ